MATQGNERTHLLLRGGSWAAVRVLRFRLAEITRDGYSDISVVPLRVRTLAPFRSTWSDLPVCKNQVVIRDVIFASLANNVEPALSVKGVYFVHALRHLSGCGQGGGM